MIQLYDIDEDTTWMITKVNQKTWNLYDMNYTFHKCVHEMMM